MHDFIHYVLDQLSGLPGVVSRPMFGGHGLYQGETFFGIVMDGRLYFKTDASTAGEYRQRGMEPFRASEKQVLKTYYEVPADVVDSRNELGACAERAVRVGSAGGTRKMGKRKR